jgi:hypothetical protein
MRRTLTTEFARKDCYSDSKQEESQMGGIHAKGRKLPLSLTNFIGDNVEGNNLVGRRKLVRGSVPNEILLYVTGCLALK